MPWRALERLAWSGVWVALAAGALALAAARAMGVPATAELVAIVVAGTLCVYDVDRLRDRSRDRATSPRRTAFVDAHADALGAVAVLAGVAAGALALRTGPAAALLLAPVAGLGLAHRRVKHLAFAKSAYLTLAWVCVVVLLPAMVGGAPRHVGWTALVLGAALQANAIASNVRDAEAGAQRIGSGAALRLARISAAAGVALALVAPAPVRPLALVAALTWLALAGFRPDEGYGLVVVDGALLVGGLLAAYVP